MGPSTSSWPGCSISSVWPTPIISPSGRKIDPRTLAFQRRPSILGFRLHRLRHHPARRRARAVPLRSLLFRFVHGGIDCGGLADEGAAPLTRSAIGPSAELALTHPTQTLQTRAWCQTPAGDTVPPLARWLRLR